MLWKRNKFLGVQYPSYDNFCGAELQDKLYLRQYLFDGTFFRADRVERRKESGE